MWMVDIFVIYNRIMFHKYYKILIHHGYNAMHCPRFSGQLMENCIDSCLENQYHGRGRGGGREGEYTFEKQCNNDDLTLSI